jgi:hypothetical protein
MGQWRLCKICRSALVLHERALAGGVGVPFHDFERPVEDLLGAHAAIDKELDVAQFFDDLALLATLPSPRTARYAAASAIGILLRVR